MATLPVSDWANLLTDILLHGETCSLMNEIRPFSRLKSSYSPDVVCVGDWIKQQTRNCFPFCVVVQLSRCDLAVSSSFRLCQQRLQLERPLFAFVDVKKLLCLSVFLSSLYLFLSVFIIQWAKPSWCLLLYHPPSACLSGCCSSSLTNVKNRPVQSFSSILLFCPPLATLFLPLCLS